MSFDTPRPPEGYYRSESGIILPKELPSQNMLVVLKPNPDWAASPERASWEYHGDGHIARLVILEQLLVARLKENNFPISRIQEFALLLAVLTHDLQYKKENEMRHFGVVSRQEYFVPHMEAAADIEWLEGILNELRQRPTNLFTGILEDEIRKVAIMTSQINLVHDYRSENDALEQLQKVYPGIIIPEEYHIFLDLDSGLERVRVEAAIHNILQGSLLERLILNSKTLEQLSLQRLHNPYFEETKHLLPVARDLYQVSTSLREYGEDQWVASIVAGSILGLFDSKATEK